MSGENESTPAAGEPPVIVLASRNPAKVREIQAILAPQAVRVVSLAEVDPQRAIPEPAEPADSFAANARAKAAYYARATGRWALADDSGLEVDALGGAPGVRSARYALAELGGENAAPPKEQIDQANNLKLLRKLAGVSDDRRSARFVCRLCLSDGPGTLLEASGVLAGRIALRPAGSNGFGYDPLFYVPALGCTTAQLAPEKKNEISHRGQAVREFAKQLGELLAAGKAPPPCRS